MNTVIVGLFVLAVAYGAPQQRSDVDRPTPVPLLSRTEVRDGSGQFVYSFETGNGIIVNEQGTFKTIKDEPVLVKKGSFSYNSPDGTPVQLQYEADELGFRPVGKHLPVSVQEETAKFI